MATKKTTTKKLTQKTTSAGKAPAQAATSKKPAAKQATAKSPAQKMSALDAAAKVLAEAKEPLSAKQMIERMRAKGYWKSPGGQTPSATLYAAITREVKNKGKQARFKKTDRGLFGLNAAK